VESEYRVLYLRFTGQKNRESVKHALTKDFEVATDRFFEADGPTD
jgi:hypothetical protein